MSFFADFVSFLPLFWPLFELFLVENLSELSTNQDLCHLRAHFCAKKDPSIFRPPKNTVFLVKNGLFWLKSDIFLLFPDLATFSDPILHRVLKNVPKSAQKWPKSAYFWPKKRPLFWPLFEIPENPEKNVVSGGSPSGRNPFFSLEATFNFYQDPNFSC